MGKLKTLITLAPILYKGYKKLKKRGSGRAAY